jgi:L-ribulokinase
MGQGFDATYYPNQQRVPVYAKRYDQYIKFGGFIENSTSMPVGNVTSDQPSLATA